MAEPKKHDTSRVAIGIVVIFWVLVAAAVVVIALVWGR